MQKSSKSTMITASQAVIKSLTVANEDKFEIMDMQIRTACLRGFRDISYTKSLSNDEIKELESLPLGYKVEYVSDRIYPYYKISW